MRGYTNVNSLSQILQDTASFVLVSLGLMTLIQNQKSDESAPPEDTYPLAWWVTVTTQQPDYEYFFGPFEQKDEAEKHLCGYSQDLSDEGAIQIKASVIWCQPEAITRALRQVSA